MVQARRCERRSRRHVRAGHVQFSGTRRRSRSNPKRRDCSNPPAKLGHAVAAYDLGLLYMQGEQFVQDFKRAGELFAIAAEAGNPEAQYALATMYKEGRGVTKDMSKAMRLMQQASIAGNLDAMVEFAIAQFNGDGTPKDETAAAAKLFLKAAHLGSPIAQNRVARILMAGRGLPADPTEALKWHIISKAGGASDPDLDVFAGQANAGRARGRRQGSQEMAVDRGRLPALDDACHHRQTARAMQHSALLNVMIAAARKAARALKRDFGELEKLQVSLKGPAISSPPPTAAPRKRCTRN